MTKTHCNFNNTHKKTIYFYHLLLTNKNYLSFLLEFPSEINFDGGIEWKWRAQVFPLVFFLRCFFPQMFCPQTKCTLFDVAARSECNMGFQWVFALIFFAAFFLLGYALCARVLVVVCTVFISVLICTKEKCYRSHVFCRTPSHSEYLSFWHFDSWG